MRRINDLAMEYSFVHLVEPVPIGGDLGYYSGEDMPEKSSMMAHSDVMVTVYSTMALEASIHETPVISLCIDSLSGWPENFSLNLSQIGEWPTHKRFISSRAGKEAQNPTELKNALNYYLTDPEIDKQIRQEFVSRECTYVDGSAGKNTGEFLVSLLEE
jgi:CDP-glycerol glycerophosphotransferase (TagB/SpsB family)